MKTIIALAAIVFALSSALMQITQAEQPEPTATHHTEQDDLRAEIAALKRRVAELQRRLDALEKKPAAAYDVGDIITLIDRDGEPEQIQRIAAAVRQIQPNGNLSIAAKRMTQDQATTTETTITGFVRPANIAAQSRSVFLDEIENLRISKTIRKQ